MPRRSLSRKRERGSPRAASAPSIPSSPRKALQERALALREARLGPPDVALSLNNLALLRRDMGSASEAEDPPRESARDTGEAARALAPRRRCDPPHAGRSHDGDRSVWGGETPPRRALDIRETQLGADHPYVAMTLDDPFLAGREGGPVETE